MYEDAACAATSSFEGLGVFGRRAFARSEGVQNGLGLFRERFWTSQFATAHGIGAPPWRQRRCIGCCYIGCYPHIRDLRAWYWVFTIAPHHRLFALLPPGGAHASCVSLAAPPTHIGFVLSCVCSLDWWSLRFAGLALSIWLCAALAHVPVSPNALTPGRRAQH